MKQFSDHLHNKFPMLESQLVEPLHALQENASMIKHIISESEESKSNEKFDMNSMFSELT